MPEGIQGMNNLNSNMHIDETVLKICSDQMHIDRYFERRVENLLALSGKNILSVFS